MSQQLYVLTIEYPSPAHLCLLYAGAVYGTWDAFRYKVLHAGCLVLSCVHWLEQQHGALSHSHSKHTIVCMSADGTNAPMKMPPTLSKNAPALHPACRFQGSTKSDT